MADYRFKIQGSSSPFLIKLWELDEGSCVEEYNHICDEVMEYSGDTPSSLGYNVCTSYTCAVLSKLKSDTTYKVDITDSVGNSTCLGFTSATDPGPPPVFNVNIELCGTPYTPTACVRSLLDPNITAGACKGLTITPPLTTGQCMRVCFFGEADDGPYDVALIELFKRCGTSGSYSRFLKIEDDDDDEYVCMGVGDAVCYNMSGVLTHTQSSQSYSYACNHLRICGTSNLTNIDSVTCGPQTQLDVDITCCTTTTTTTTGLPTVQVYWDTPVISDTGYAMTSRARLVTNPPLTAGQSFRLNMYDKAYACYQTYLVRSTSANAYVNEDGGSAQVQASVVSPTTAGPTYNDDITTGYIDVAQDVYEDGICAYTRATSHVTNDGLGHTVYGCARINSITNMVGANYILVSPIGSGGRTIVSCVDIAASGGGFRPPYGICGGYGCCYGGYRQFDYER